MSRAAVVSDLIRAGARALKMPGLARSFAHHRSHSAYRRRVDGPVIWTGKLEQ